MNDKLNNKFEQIQKLSSWEHLPDKNKAFLMDVIKQYRLTYQQSRHVIDIVLDFENWHESLDILKRPYEHRQRFLETITNRWDELKTLPADSPPVGLLPDDAERGLYHWNPVLSK